MIVEFFTALIGILIFTVSFTTKKFNQNSFLYSLGPGVFVSSIIVFLHAVTYKGMNIIPGYDANLPTQLWIVLNYCLSISFLFAIWNQNRKTKYYILIAANSTMGIIATFLCFTRNFPDCFIPGTGLTLFKKISEFIIMFIYLCCILLLYKNKGKANSRIFNTLIKAILLFIVAGIMFTLYQDVYGIQNFIGHYLRLLSFFLIYLSVVVEYIQKPYDTIFEKLNNLSITDGLTDLFNHRYFIEQLEKHINKSSRENKEWYLIVFDLGNFKNINDTYGHLIGDNLLKEVAKIIKSNIRTSDFAFRHGGDEFSIIAYDTNQENVQQIISRLQETFAVTTLTDKKVRISLSGGIARYTKENVDEVISKADHLLYRAKQDGRNRIYFDMVQYNDTGR
jgi:diguanylate cyclase (GGDEF)-like protein